MRPTRQALVVNLHVEGLEELKKQLEAVIVYIQEVIQKGKSWLNEEDGSLTYFEINQYLINESCVSMQRCLQIASGNDKVSETSLKNDQSDNNFKTSKKSLEEEKSFAKMQEKLEEMQKCIMLHSEKISHMEQNINNQEIQNRSIWKEKEEFSKSTDLKFDEISSKLKEEISLISQLKSQMKSFSNNKKENEKIIANLQKRIQKLESTSQTISKKISLEIDMNKLAEEFRKDLSKNTELIVSVQHEHDLWLGKFKQIEKKFNETLHINEPVRTFFSDVLKQHQSSMHEDGFLPIATDVNELIVGFDACVKARAPPFNLRRNQILTCFQQVTEDLHKDYNMDTGIFTVNMDGLYLLSLTIDVASFTKNDLQFFICIKKSSGEEFFVASCHTDFRGRMVSDVGIRKLKKDEQIYVKSSNDCNDLVLSNFSHFLCVLLKKF